MLFRSAAGVAPTKGALAETALAEAAAGAGGVYVLPVDDAVQLYREVRGPEAI